MLSYEKGRLGGKTPQLELVNVPKTKKITVCAGRLFDGFTAVTGEHIEIAIEGGLIKDVRSRPHMPVRASMADTDILDLREYTVLPGMIDCHVHLALDGKDFNKALAQWTQEDLLRDRIRTDLANTLSAGIVAVRDGGDRENIGLAIRAEVRRGILPGPIIRAAGTALVKEGNYGSFLGPGLTGKKIRAAVKKTAKRGVDQIKVLVSGVVSFKKYSRVGGLQFEEGELEEIVTTARNLGIKVMAHASSDEAVRLAVRAGVNSVEHGYFISRSSLEAMAAAEIPWIPTLVPVASQIRGRLKERYSHEEREVIQKTLLRQQRMVRAAVETGVKLGAGTDAGAGGVLHGKGYLDELLLLEESGLSREEVLRAATSSGSSILGLEKEMGMVRPGCPPYLIAVRGNPLDDLNSLRNVAFMIRSSAG
jgi:imidazolonepropionase-like amidohydrolase